MKRHPALQPLSRDHHNILLHARRLRGDDPRHTVPHAAARFGQYAEAVLAHHFEEEEASLLPYLPADLARRLRGEHEAILAAAAALRQTADAQTARDLGALLRDHVRFEEDTIFQHLQGALDPLAWQELQAQGAAVRRRLRPGVGPDEACFL